MSLTRKGKPPKPPLSLSPPSLPAGTVGQAYNQTISASGGSPPYRYSFTGSLPAGLVLSTGGVLSGTPTAVGTYSFAVRVTDKTQTAATQSYTVAIAAAEVPPEQPPSSSFPVARGHLAKIFERPKPMPVQSWGRSYISAAVSGLTPQLFLDASGLALNTTNSYGSVDASNNVTSMKDVSGGTGAWTFPCPDAHYPQLNVAAQNGRNTVTFTAGTPGQRLVCTSFVQARPFIVFAAIKLVTNAAGVYIFDDTTGAHRVATLVDDSTGHVGIWVTSGLGATTANDNTWRVIAFDFINDGTTGRIYWDNNTLNISGAVGTNAFTAGDGMKLGSKWDDTGSGGMVLGEMRIYSYTGTSAATSDIATVMSALASKWGTV